MATPLPKDLRPEASRNSLDAWLQWIRGTFDPDDGTVNHGYVDGITSTDGTALQIKVVNIGDWNMDSDATKAVAHGVTLSTIRAVFGVIRDDSGTRVSTLVAGFNLSTANPDLGILGSGSGIDSTNVTLVRRTSGAFDSTDYNATSYNRGWVVLLLDAS